MQIRSVQLTEVLHMRTPVQAPSWALRNLTFPTSLPQALAAPSQPWSVLASVTITEGQGCPGLLKGRGGSSPSTALQRLLGVPCLRGALGPGGAVLRNNTLVMCPSHGPTMETFQFGTITNKTVMNITEHALFIQTHVECMGYDRLVSFCFQSALLR